MLTIVDPYLTAKYDDVGSTVYAVLVVDITSVLGIRTPLSRKGSGRQQPH
jgi:hypothetical protein